MAILKRIIRKFRILRDNAGTAAVEFALGAPVVIFSFVMMSDIGFAINQKMVLDQALRAGASYAMQGESDPAVLKKLVISSATGQYSATPTADALAARPNVDVTKKCECPDGSTPATCSTLCLPEELPPSIYFVFAASKTYNAMMLPDIPLNSTITVQVR